MRNIWLLIMFFSGCSSVTVCDYPLSGMVAVENPPEKLLTDKNKGYFWFKNGNGDYLACPEKVNKDYCGNYYHEFKLQKDDTYEHDEIICLM